MDVNFDPMFPFAEEKGQMEIAKTEEINDTVSWPPGNPPAQTTSSNVNPMMQLMNPNVLPYPYQYAYMQQAMQSNLYYGYPNYSMAAATPYWMKQECSTSAVQTPPRSPASPTVSTKVEDTPSSAKYSPSTVEKKARKSIEVILAQCQLCQKEEYNSGHMSMIMSHLAFHDKSLARYACTKCGFSFTRRDKVREHIASKCEGGKLEIKQNSFYKEKLRRWATHCFPESLVERIMEQSAKEAEKFTRLSQKEPKRSNMISCRKCNKEVRNSPGSRNHHAKTHSDIKQYRCSQCGHTGLMKDNLKIHSIKHHGRETPIEDLFDSQMMEEYAKLHEECFPLEDRKNSRQSTSDQLPFNPQSSSLGMTTPIYGFGNQGLVMNSVFPNVPWGCYQC